MPDDCKAPFFTIGVRPGSRRDQIRKAAVITASMGWFAFPISGLLSSQPSAARLVLAALGFFGFMGIYLGQGLQPVAPDTPRLVAWICTLMAIATAMTLFERPSWGLMFIFAACAAGLSLPPRPAIPLIALCTALAGGLELALGDPDGTAVSFGATTLAIGGLMAAFGQLIRANAALRQARERLAERAVDEERLRFARDLHDLLGHDLSVIALKAQLARRLMGRDPAAAEREISDVEQVTRTALTQVREAVSGYRQPRLATELAGARSALDAAGIACTVEHAEVSLPPSREAVLAWGVREATTNVIRHSHARHCDIRIQVALDEACLEVTDDGPAGHVNGADGTGLRGLAERAQAAGGRVLAGPRPAGGFGLELRLPLGRTA